MSKTPPPAPPAGYWHATHRPLQCLYFLLPLLAAYEVGTLLRRVIVDGEPRRILAERAITEFFAAFGVAGLHLPAVTIVVVLLAWHLARRKHRDPASPQWRTLVGMLAESCVLVMPLFVMSLLTQRLSEAAPRAAEAAGFLLQATARGGIEGEWLSLVLLSIGAGLYEELVFRLLGIAALMMLLEDVLALPKAWAALGAVAASSLLFAAYHFWGAWGAIDGPRFAFYTLAGLYFAGLYVLRGFGVVVAVHAFYDVLIVSAPRLAGGV